MSVAPNMGKLRKFENDGPAATTRTQHENVYLFIGSHSGHS